MASTDDPRTGLTDVQGAAGPGALQAWTEVSQAEALASPGTRGALFAHWGRLKRRELLQRRYADEYGDEYEDGLLQ